MENKLIAFFDSGIGGLTTLAAAIAKNLPADFVYYADTKNAPFGSKNGDEIFKITENAMCVFNDLGVDAVVLACNTATAACVDRLRATATIPIVGAEPAVRLACVYNKVAILATPHTAESQRFKKLVESNLMGEYKIFALSKLATQIEDECFNLGSVMQNFTEQYNLTKYDCIVLGCTHYIFLRSLFEEKYTAAVVDGNDGLAARLKSLVGGNSSNRIATNIRVLGISPQKCASILSAMLKAYNFKVVGSNIMCYSN